VQKFCFEQRNAWSRFTLVGLLFKLHEIW